MTHGDKTFVDIYTDGACSGNPGAGGWGALLRFGDREKEICGGENLTTNNRMELMAAIKALEALKKRVNVRLYTDSQYVQRGINEWMAGWKAKGWPARIKNQDLWKRLDKAVSEQNVEFFWVRGHNGHVDNERADELARSGIPK